MPLFDKPLEELRRYRPARHEPDDFDSFWADTISNARSYPLEASFEPVDYGLRTLETYDVTFNGFGGHPIKGWFLVPRQAARPLACVVETIGYTGGRSFPTVWTFWPSAGYAHFVMDTRGQGSGWLHGDTPDPGASPGSPHTPGFFTQGILSPETYYYRRVFTDAVRAIEAVRDRPEVNPNRIGVAGGSQGGGIALAVSGLSSTVGACLPDCPAFCHFRRATELVAHGAYMEIVDYCRSHRDQVDRVFETLSYFEEMNFAARAKAHALFSVGLMDDICPPSGIFAAYNYYGGPKDIRTYDFNQHDGGGSHQRIEQLHFLSNLWPG